MEASRRFARNARHLLLCTIVIGAAATATTLAAAPAANAETNYSCEKCWKSNGPDEWMDYVGGTLYSGSGVAWVDIWKNNGGGSYGEVWSGEINVVREVWHIEHCLGYEHRIYGHGNIHVPEYPEFLSHISGKEWLWYNKEGPC